MKCDYRTLGLFLLPSLIGLFAVLASLSGATTGLEPDDVRYFAQYQEFLSSPIKHWRLAFVITNSWLDHWWVEPGYVKYFRPLPILTYFLDQFLFGESAKALLATNLLFYFILCISVTGLLCALTHNKGACALAAIWFATLPIHAEGVAYIAGRTDVLAWTFGAIFLRAHLLQQSMSMRIICLLGALACKEYSLTLLIFILFLNRKGTEKLRSSRAREWITYCIIGGTYLLIRFVVIDGQSLLGTPLPLYFPAQNLPDILYHLALQTLSFISLAVFGLSAAMYATEITSTIAIAASFALPIFGVILFLAQRNKYFIFTTLFLLFTLLMTAPLYVSQRYYLGPSIAFACCIAIAVDKLTSKRLFIVASLIAFSVIALHIKNLFFDIRLQFDNKTRGVVSSAEVIAALEGVHDELKSCNSVLVVDAPRGQVFHMFLSEFFKLASNTSDLRTVILSVQNDKDNGEIQKVNYHQPEQGVLLVTSESPLVQSHSTDMVLPLETQPVNRQIGSDARIFVENGWRSIRVTLNPNSMNQWCLAEFKYLPSVQVEVRGAKSTKDF